VALRRAPFFYCSGKTPLDGAPVERDPEPLGHLPEEVLPGQVGGLCAALPDELEDLPRALARGLRPPLGGHEPDQSLALVLGRDLVEGRAGDAEPSRDLADGHLLDPVSAQHLVPDLDLIPPVEELACLEELVPDPLGMRVERAAGAEVLLLGVG